MTLTLKNRPKRKQVKPAPILTLERVRQAVVVNPYERTDEELQGALNTLNEYLAMESRNELPTDEFYDTIVDMNGDAAGTALKDPSLRVLAEQASAYIDAIILDREKQARTFSLGEINQAIHAIRTEKDHDVSLYDKEIELHQRFIRYIAAGGDENLRQKAQLVLSTRDIPFRRETYSPSGS